MVSGTKRNAFLIGIALLVLSNLIDNASSNDIVSNDSDVGGLFYFSVYFFVYFLCSLSCSLFGHLNRQVFDTKRSTSFNLFTLHCNRIDNVQETFVEETKLQIVRFSDILALMLSHVRQMYFISGFFYSSFSFLRCCYSIRNIHEQGTFQHLDIK